MDSRTEVILKTVLAGGDVSSITPKSRIEELLIALGQAITDISQPSEEEIATAVNNWLTEHKSELDVIPDGSITQEKLSRAIYNDVDSLSDIVSTNTEEISKLNETMADKMDTLKISNNRFDKTKITDGYYVDTGKGTLIASSTMSVTDYCDIKTKNNDNKLWAYINKNNNWIFSKICFYDINKVFIKGFNISENPITIPNNAYYARLSTNHFMTNPSRKNTAYISVNQDIFDNYEVYDNTNAINYAKNASKKGWNNRTALFYGDSITAINNPDCPTDSWGAYVKNYLGMAAAYGRGIGGQTYKVNNRPWFANADGTYNSRNDSGDMTNSSSYTVPSGCTAHYGYFSSWDRITTMISDDIKDSIDLIVVFGINDGTNLTETYAVPQFSADNIIDTAWSTATENTLGGDYNINTVCGAIASTIMKLQARCPNAIIVFGTGLSGRGITGVNSGNYADDITGYLTENELIKKVCNYFSIPVIDIFANSGINPLNRATYIQDSVHPYLASGKKMLARTIIGGLNGIIPNL